MGNYLISLSYEGRKILYINSAALCIDFLVQESMEMIDNPLHEAAKRGNINFMNECIANQVCRLFWSLTLSACELTSHNRSELSFTNYRRLV